MQESISAGFSPFEAFRVQGSFKKKVQWAFRTACSSRGLGFQGSEFRVQGLGCIEIVKGLGAKNVLTETFCDWRESFVTGTWFWVGLEISIYFFLEGSGFRV